MRAAALQALTQTIQSLARQEGASFILYDYLNESERLRQEANAGLSWMTIPDPGTALAIHWPDFEAYLHGLGKSAWKDYRRHANRAADMDLIITRQHQPPNLEEALPLIRAVEEHHQNAPIHFVRAVLENFPMVDGTWIEARIGGRLAGCGLLLSDGDEMVATMLGLDYGVQYVYFQIVYEAIRCAIEQGIRVLYAGSGAYDFKAPPGVRDRLKSLDCICWGWPDICSFRKDRSARLTGIGTSKERDMDLETFLRLPNQEFADLVRGHGEQVCVFPINGTRRWFLLEHGSDAGDNSIQAYMDVTAAQEIKLFKLIFDQGVDTLLSPMFGHDLLERGDEYIARVGADGLQRLACGADFLAFYAEYGVRVHFYGDYRRVLAGTPFAYLIDSFEQAAERTAQNDRSRLFFGVFANDVTELTAELAVEHYQRNGRTPNRATLVEMVYGEPVAPVSFFIGFDRFSAFDMPLLASGNEDLYFTVGPSPYLSEGQLRRILYDHLYARRVEEQDYSAMPKQDLTWMRSFYGRNQGNTLGVGAVQGGVWFPLEQVNWPVDQAGQRSERVDLN